jgi:hypothetical protein
MINQQIANPQSLFGERRVVDPELGMLGTLFCDMDSHPKFSHSLFGIKIRNFKKKNTKVGQKLCFFCQNAH